MHAVCIRNGPKHSGDKTDYTTVHSVAFSPPPLLPWKLLSMSEGAILLQRLGQPANRTIKHDLTVIETERKQKMKRAKKMHRGEGEGKQDTQGESRARDEHRLKGEGHSWRR